MLWPGRYAEPLPVLTIRPRPRSIIPGHDRAPAQERTEDVDLERVPPLVRVVLPGLAAPVRDPGVRDEEVDRPQLPVDVGHHALDVLLPGDVGDDPEATDLTRDLLDLVGRARRDRDFHSRVGQLASDARADPATAARDERDLSVHPVRHEEGVFHASIGSWRDPRRARRHRRDARRSRPGREPLRPVGDPRLPARRPTARAERAHGR